MHYTEVSTCNGTIHASNPLTFYFRRASLLQYITDASLSAGNVTIAHMFGIGHIAWQIIRSSYHLSFFCQICFTHLFTCKCHELCLSMSISTYYHIAFNFGTSKVIQMNE